MRRLYGGTDAVRLLLTHTVNEMKLREGKRKITAAKQVVMRTVKITVKSKQITANTTLTGYCQIT